jgi:methyl-accepting chemotaxis protein
MGKMDIKARFSKIGIKLLIPYLTIYFLFFILICGIIYYNFEVQIDSIQKIQEEISIKASSEINYYIKNIIKELDLISKNIFCVECAYDNNRKILKNLMEEEPSIHTVSIINKEGMEIIKIVRYDPKASSTLNDVSDEDKFKKAVEGDYYIGSVYISEYSLPFITISLPILDEDNKKIGILAAEVDLSPMWETVSKIKVKKTGYVYVVDQNGNLIAYKDVSLVKKNLDMKDVEGVKNFMNHNHSFESYTSFNNEKVIGSWKSIDITGWGLIIELPDKEVFEELLILFYIAGISIFISIIAILLILKLSYSISNPIKKLTKNIEDISMGKLDVEIDPKLKESKDEIGDLAKAFDRTIVSLKLAMKQVNSSKKEEENQ